MPVAIDDGDAAEVLERFDGLLLMGGGDLHPQEYGRERRDEIYGVIEGIELDGDAWIVGAQWHPEDTAADDPAQQRLFDTFVRQVSVV